MTLRNSFRPHKDNTMHRNPDVEPRPPVDLLNRYRDVTTRGTNFTLNAGVDREGQLPDDQVERLLELGEAITQFGALRKTNGHPEPYNIRYWNVGNEVKSFAR